MKLRMQGQSWRACDEDWSRQSTDQPRAGIAATAENLQAGESVGARLEVTRSPVAIEAEVVPDDGGEAGAPQREGE